MTNEKTRLETPEDTGELIFKLGDRPPMHMALFAAFQHLLAIFVPIITPPLIICSALGLDVRTTSDIVSMSLLISGVATAIQVAGKGGIGSGLLSVQGTSFTFVSTLINIGNAGGLPLIFGTCLLGSVVEIVFSRVIPVIRRLIPPLVSGIAVTLIGLSLIGAGIDSCAGGAAARAAGSYAALKNLAIAALVIVVIVLTNRSKHPLLRMSSILLGIAAGYAVSSFLGWVQWKELGTLDWVAYPVPMRYGLKVTIGALIPMSMLYLVTSIETIGDITATSMVSGEPVKGPLYIRRISRGVLADGLNSTLAAVFNTFPNTTFSQNNGIIRLTGIASRYVGFWIAGLLVLLGLSPRISGLFTIMPAPVLGGGTLIMFGTVAAVGIKMIAMTEMDRHALMVVALSLAAGFGVILNPGILTHLPAWGQHILGSGVVTGSLEAFISNLLLRGDSRSSEPLS
ncbi:MAG: nucleobase:cation symporter-2 family protein [Lentisphaerota bacterium]